MTNKGTPRKRSAFFVFVLVIVIVKVIVILPFQLEADVLCQEFGHLVEVHACDVEDEVVVAQVVAGGVGDVLDEIVTSFVDAVHRLLGFGCDDIQLRGDTCDTGLAVGAEEEVQGVGIVAEDMESGASDDDTTIFLGQLAEGACLGIVEAQGRGVGLGANGMAYGTELLIEAAEVAPPVDLLRLDLLHVLDGHVELLGDGFEHLAAVDFQAQLLAEQPGYLAAAAAILAVDGYDNLVHDDKRKCLNA